MKLQTDDGTVIARITFDPYQIDVLDKDAVPSTFTNMGGADTVEGDPPDDPDDGSARERWVDASAAEKRRRTKALAASYGFQLVPENVAE